MARRLGGKVFKESGSAPAVLKVYSRRDTERFKCWGSGARNEDIVRDFLGSAVPEIVAAWSDQTTEYVRLEWIEGQTFDATQANAEQMNAAGQLLGRIHTFRSGSWGALNGMPSFGDGSAAFTSRFTAAIRLLAKEHRSLSDRLERWVGDAMTRVQWDEPATLVHGDFGPANLLWSGGHLRVIDWEHARWGHPREDWALIRDAIRFPQPNGFGPGTEAIGQLEAGWSRETGRILPANEPLDIMLDAYYAACLGVFFGERPNQRLAWLTELVGTK